MALYFVLSWLTCFRHKEEFLVNKLKYSFLKREDKGLISGLNQPKYVEHLNLFRVYLLLSFFMYLNPLEIVENRNFTKTITGLVFITKSIYIELSCVYRLFNTDLEF
jgi:hypothetical protein